jgi:hypothetical protein
MKKIKNKILHSVRTPMFRQRVMKDRKKESKKKGDFINEGIVPPDSIFFNDVSQKPSGSIRTT